MNADQIIQLVSGFHGQLTAIMSQNAEILSLLKKTDYNDEFKVATEKFDALTEDFVKIFKGERLEDSEEI